MKQPDELREKWEEELQNFPYSRAEYTKEKLRVLDALEYLVQFVMGNCKCARVGDTNYINICDGCLRLQVVRKKLGGE